MNKRAPHGMTKTEAKLQEIQIWISAITRKIYAGYVKANGKEAKARVDVTDRVIEAAATYLEHNGGVIEFENGSKLVFLPPDTKPPESTAYCECVDQTKSLIIQSHNPQLQGAWCPNCSRPVKARQFY